MIKKAKRLSLRIVSITGGTALVEFRNPGLLRGYLPIELIDQEDMTADLEDLEAATPYGIEWERIITIDPDTPQKIAAELRESGIFTRADLDRNPQVVVNIFQKYLRFEVGQLRQRILEV